MRLFIAVPLPAHWRRALAGGAAAIRARSPRFTPTRKENFHLTLAFLGEQPGPERAIAALEGLHLPPFSLTTGQPGCFPRGKEAIWWLGLEPCPPLLDLRAALAQALEEQGIPLEKGNFRPHLTLARRVDPRAGVTTGRLAPLLPPMTCRVDRVVLYRSHRVEGVLTYSPLFCHPLKKKG